LNTILFNLENISFSYEADTREIFSGLDFSLSAGERVAITGPAGAGKTTLLQLMVGLLKPCSGEIYAFGRERRTEKDFREVRSKTGFGFQNPDDQLFCATVMEDVAFGPLNLGMTKDEAISISIKTLEELGLKDYEGKITYKLSGGEKRLVALASVLSMNPEVLLLDEPSTGLDDFHTGRLTEILSFLDKTLVIVSHNIPFNEKLCGKRLRLESGRGFSSSSNKQ